MARTEFHRNLILPAIEQRRTAEILTKALNFASDVVAGNVVPETVDPADDAFTFLFAINQVEDIVMNTQISVEETNKALVAQHDTQLSKNAAGLVIEAGIDIDDFDDLFDSFSVEIEDDRVERVLDIERLRIRMLRYFAGDRPVETTAAATRQRSAKSVRALPKPARRARMAGGKK